MPSLKFSESLKTIHDYKIAPTCRIYLISISINRENLDISIDALIYSILAEFMMPNLADDSSFLGGICGPAGLQRSPILPSFAPTLTPTNLQCLRSSHPLTPKVDEMIRWACLTANVDSTEIVFFPPYFLFLESCYCLILFKLELLVSDD